MMIKNIKGKGLYIYKKNPAEVAKNHKGRGFRKHLGLKTLNAIGTCREEDKA